MIKYLGSKRQLIGHILDAVRLSQPSATSLVDLFSGTSRVGHAFKKEGFQVFANDHNFYAYTLAKCYIETDLDLVEKKAASLISEFNRLPPKPDYFTEHYCDKAQFFHPKNGARVDAIREAIEQKDLPDNLKAVLLVSLMEAADRVDSTCGLQMSFLKQWAPRAHNDLELRLPNLLPKSAFGAGKAHCLEAIDAARKLKADVVYLDPPYNQHSYRGNYHIWETLLKWDKPAVYGKVEKRQDCKEIKSDFNSKVRFFEAFSKVVQAVQAKLLVVSFNNEGFISRHDMEQLLSSRGKVQTQVIKYKRYVGAQIGIFNPKGDKVGKVSHLRNEEFLYTVQLYGKDS